MPDLHTAVRSETIIELLDIEISRALVSAFSVHTATFKPTEAHYQAFEAAQDARGQVDEAESNPDILLLAQHWLTLMGHRIACEESLLIAGLDALRIRAAECLHLSPKETRGWDVSTLLDVFANTSLRSEWRYNTFEYRLRRHIRAFEPDPAILNEAVRGTACAEAKQ